MEALRDMRLPPGFGFHPSDTELVSHYLKRKILGQKIEYDLIPEVDIYKHEPWDLPAKCNLPIKDNKWHFFASRDRKYPTGSRSNRATIAGYWKSTGKDRAIKLNKRTLGTKKTLVFHEGRPPSGRRTEWIMHEYYIDDNECQVSPDMKDAFVLCRVTKRTDWALENDNEVGNSNPHLQQLNNAATPVVTAVKPEDAAALVICPEEPKHVATPVGSAELSNDIAMAATTTTVDTRNDWALENDNEVGNGNPHLQQLNDAATPVVTAVKPEDAASSVICPEEPKHVATPVGSAELSNDIAMAAISTTVYTPSPNSGNELEAWLAELVDTSFSFNPVADAGSADISLTEQCAESSNLQNHVSVAPKIGPDHASPIQDGTDATDYLFTGDLPDDLYSMLYPGTDKFDSSMFLEQAGQEGIFFATDQAFLVGMDPYALPNNFENGIPKGELQLDQENSPDLSNGNIDNGITVQRRSTRASPANISTGIRHVKMQVGIKRMVTSNSESINQTLKFADNSGRRLDLMTNLEHQKKHTNDATSVKHSDADKPSECHGNQGYLNGIKNTTLRCSSAGFKVYVLLAVLVVGVALVLRVHRSGASLQH